MKSLNEIIYSIKENLRDYSDDTDITTDHLRYLVDVYRSFFIRRDLKKFHNPISEDIIQDLGCIEMELSDPSECCDIDTGCTVLRTKQKIPAPMQTYMGDSLTRIGPINKIKSNFSHVSYRRAIYSGNGSFNSLSVFAFYLNGRIYLKLGPENREGRHLDLINARGIFESPREVGKFTKCSGEPCYSDDDPYPVKSYMIPMIEEKILQVVSQKLSTPEDDQNDAQDERTISREKGGN